MKSNEGSEELSTRAEICVYSAILRLLLRNCYEYFKILVYLASLAMGYTARVLFPAGKRDFSFFCIVQTASEAHPSSCPMGTGSCFLWIKRSERETDHVSPSSAEVKMVELYLHSHIRLHGAVLNPLKPSGYYTYIPPALTY
jgi:hypothetical protein